MKRIINITNLNKNNLLTLNENNIDRIEGYNNNQEILKFTDNELNSLEYEKALIEDNRTYIQYYLSLIRTNHLLIFSLNFYNNDYNSQIIKTLLLFFFLDIDFVVNALFFNDNTMHKIYVENGYYNFIYQLPKIIYSSIISGIFGALIKFFALTEKILIKFKNNKEINTSDIEKLKSTLKIKFILFYIISFLLLISFSYYISCFCGVYVNTQVHLIKDTLISFGISLIYPFGISLIPGIFRKCALNDEQKDKKYMYKFSQLIENI